MINVIGNSLTINRVWTQPMTRVKSGDIIRVRMIAARTPEAA